MRMHRNGDPLWYKIQAKYYETRSMANKRGIGFSEEWENDFRAFYDWMVEHNYNFGMKIVRKDKTKPFGPDNCELASLKTEYYGKTIEEWAAIYNISVNHIYSMMCKGYDIKLIGEMRCKREAMRDSPLNNKYRRMKGNAKNTYHGKFKVLWKSYEEFYDWAINNGWKEGMYVVRKDKNGDYGPDNCAIVENIAAYTDYSKRVYNRKPKRSPEERRLYMRERQRNYYWKNHEKQLARSKERYWRDKYKNERGKNNRVSEEKHIETKDKDPGSNA